MEGVAQEHRRRKDCTERICNPLPRDVGRTAVNRLKEARARTDRCGWHQPDRATDHRRLIREDVAEEVARHNHIELRRAHGKLHGAVVHVEMIERHIAVFGRECRHRAPPEPRGCEHIRLVHGRDLAAAQTCRLERKACDTFYLGHGVVLHVPCALRDL